MQGDKRHKLFRSSIISNILAIESAANICIESMQLPKSLYEDIKKLSIIGKFNFFAYSKFNKTLDKSLNEYSILKSLIKVRNDFVHPKVENGIYSNENFFFDFGTKKQFNLSNDIRIWKKEDAVSLLKAHIVFMNYFFKDFCNFSKGESTNLLITMEEGISRKELDSFISMPKDDYTIIYKYLNNSIKYLDLRIHQTK